MWGCAVSLGKALGDDLARLFSMAVIAIILLPLVAFAAGWYCGDRVDVPAVRVTWGAP